MPKLRNATTASYALVVLATSILSGCAAPNSANHTVTASASAPAPTASATSGSIKPPDYSYHPAAISAACLADIRKAAELASTDVGQDPAPGDAELRASGFDCQSVDEWVSALSLYPAAMGLPSADKIQPGMDLSGICGTTPSAAAGPLCVDAKHLGLNVGYWQ